MQMIWANEKSPATSFTKESLAEKLANAAIT